MERENGPRERNVISLTWDVITTIDRRQSQVEPISGCACPAGAAPMYIEKSLGAPEFIPRRAGGALIAGLIRRRALICTTLH
jgi:hypothetical protein